MDISLLAESKNFPIETVEKTILFQQAFQKYVGKIRKKYPNQISSVYMEKLPATRGHIQFIDKVPEEILLDVEKKNQQDKIVLTGKGKISLTDNHQRSKLICKILSDKLKNKNIGTYFDNIDKVIKIEIQISDKAEEPTKENLIAMIQKEMYAGNLIKKDSIINENDIEFIITKGSKPMHINYSSRGGSRLYHNTWSNACTSGWTVAKRGVGTGILTAGHCLILNNMTHIQDHVNGTKYSTLENISHFGSGGDVGFLTTPTTSEGYSFHADDDEIRYVLDRKPTNQMVTGGYVCFYGRSSNERECGMIVETINYTTGDGAGSMARVDDSWGIPGDSGGGWSFGSIAWGVMKGSSNGKDVFTPIEVAENTLNLYILTVY